MAEMFRAISSKHIDFIDAQPIFFVATAAEDARVNVSPKGLNGFRVLGPNKAVYLDMTGSGNETAAHLKHDGRITFMFCSFSETPLILRLYGKAKAVGRKDPAWSDYARHYPPTPGARQFIVAEIDSVQTSCGFGVPLMTLEGQRPTLANWASKKTEAEILKFQADHNRRSIDGLAVEE